MWARAALLGAAAAGSSHLSQHRAARCDADDCAHAHAPTQGQKLEPEKTARDLVSSFTAGATVAAAIAPALCAVHCAAMPVIAVALPALQGSKVLGVCPHSVGRKLLFVVAPLVLISSAVGYSKHKSSATTSAALLGLSSMTVAAMVQRAAPHRNVLNGIGCVLMLGASYRGRQLEEEMGEACCAAHDHDHHD